MALALHCRRWRREKPQRAEGETSEGGEERGNLRSDYSGEEEQREGIRRGGRKERANMLVAGNPATPTVKYVQTTITAFSLQDIPPQSTAGK